MTGYYSPGISQGTLDTHTADTTSVHGITDTADLLTAVTVPHTFTYLGTVAVDLLPGFYVPVPAGMAASIISVRHAIESGTSATWTLQKNGVDLTDYTSIASSTADTTTNPADVTLADGDYIDLDITAINTAPADLHVTVFVQYTKA